ncbi:MAG: YdcF family protein [Oscillospiraceae bacterium]|nr:YdcF family protein [Oscillospiraceae bacterium]
MLNSRKHSEIDASTLSHRLRAKLLSSYPRFEPQGDEKDGAVCVVLGCGPIPLSDRVKTAVDLYKQGLVSDIVFTGGGSLMLDQEWRENATRSIATPEALEKYGVDVDVQDMKGWSEIDIIPLMKEFEDLPEEDFFEHIYSENKSTNTFENIEEAIALLEEIAQRRGEPVKRVVMVGSCFQLLRAIGIAKKKMPVQYFNKEAGQVVPIETVRRNVSEIRQLQEEIKSTGTYVDRLESHSDLIDEGEGDGIYEDINRMRKRLSELYRELDIKPGEEKPGIQYMGAPAEREWTSRGLASEDEIQQRADIQYYHGHMEGEASKVFGRGRQKDVFNGEIGDKSLLREIEFAENLSRAEKMLATTDGVTHLRYYRYDYERRVHRKTHMEVGEDFLRVFDTNKIELMVTDSLMGFVPEKDKKILFAYMNDGKVRVILQPGLTAKMYEDGSIEEERTDEYLDDGIPITRETFESYEGMLLDVNERVRQLDENASHDGVDR